MNQTRISDFCREVSFPVRLEGVERSLHQSSWRVELGPGPAFVPSPQPPLLAAEALNICENEEDHVMSPGEVTDQPQRVSAPAPHPRRPRPHARPGLWPPHGLHFLSCPLSGGGSPCYHRCGQMTRVRGRNLAPFLPSDLLQGQKQRADTYTCEGCQGASQGRRAGSRPQAHPGFPGCPAAAKLASPSWGG